MIEELTSIPILERIDDGYAYDSKYQGKLFMLKGNYILFHEASFETIPKKIIDVSISQVLDEKISTLQNNIISQVLENLNSNQIELAPVIEGITENDVVKIYDDKIAYSLQNINRVIDNINDKINSKPDLEDLQTLREHIERGVNTLLLDHISIPSQELQETNSSSDIQIHISNLNSKFNELMKNYSEIPTQTEQTIRRYISSELEIVYAGVKKMINEAFNNYNPHDNSEAAVINYKVKELDSVLQPSKIKISTLMMLKESGFTMAEIIEAHREGLI